MKVVLNALSARRGGGQTYLKNLLAYLDLAPDLDIVLITSRTLRVPAHARIRIVRPRGPTENPILRAAWERIRLPALLRRERADVLFCPGGLVPESVAKQVRTVVMFRNMMPFDMAVRRQYPPGLMRMRNWILERELLASMIAAGQVIVLSAYAGSVLAKRAKGQIREMPLIPHGVPDVFRRTQRALARPKWLPQGSYLLYVSIIDPYKHQLEVVRAFALMQEQRPSADALVLVGNADSRYAARVRAEVHRLGLEKSVLFAGEVPYDELPAVYQHAKIGIFASAVENCPNILLEALASGIPLVVSNRPPMPEFGGDAVRYFTPARPEELCAQLLRLLDDPDARAELGRKAAVRAEIYTWESAARRTWAVLRGAVGSGAAGRPVSASAHDGWTSSAKLKIEVT